MVMVSNGIDWFRVRGVNIAGTRLCTRQQDQARGCLWKNDEEIWHAPRSESERVAVSGAGGSRLRGKKLPSGMTGSSSWRRVREDHVSSLLSSRVSLSGPRLVTSLCMIIDIQAGTAEFKFL